MEIKVLGSGCAKCKQLEKIARAAVEELHVDATVDHVTDLGEIMSFGIMSTPALVIDGEVRLAGRLPKLDEVKSIITRAGA